MAKQIEVRRHTDNDGDLLTPIGVEDAVEIGRRLEGGYQIVASSGAQRATQTAACFLAGLGEDVPGGVIVEEGLRSAREDDWRAAFSKTGKGDLRSFQEADPDLVEEDSAILARGLRQLLDRLEDGQRALAVGHSPTTEAGVLGLTGVFIDPLGKGEGVVITEDDDSTSVTRLGQ